MGPAFQRPAANDGPMDIKVGRRVADHL